MISDMFSEPYLLLPPSGLSLILLEQVSYVGMTKYITEHKQQFLFIKTWWIQAGGTDNAVKNQPTNKQTMYVFDFATKLQNTLRILQF